MHRDGESGLFVVLIKPVVNVLAFIACRFYSSHIYDRGFAGRMILEVCRPRITGGRALARFRRCTHPHLSEAAAPRHAPPRPKRPSPWGRGEFKLNRGRTDETRVADRCQIFLEHPTPWRHVAVMDAVAIGHMYMGHSVPETAGQVGGRNAHQPEMRDVDSRFHIDKADLVEKALHRIERINERKFEGQQLDCEFDSFFSRMLAHLTASHRSRDPIPISPE